MASNRMGRINEEIQRELSALIRSVKDPRVTGMVSVTAVETTPCLLYTSAEDGGSARFCIEDDGRGFRPEVLRRLAVGQSPDSRETRSEDATRTMGIGLSVCKTIVAAHGGSLSLGNRPEGGASVVFTLPLNEEDHHGIEA